MLLTKFSADEPGGFAKCHEVFPDTCLICSEKSIASPDASHSTVFLTALYSPALTVCSLHISSISNCSGNQFTEFFVQQR